MAKPKIAAAPSKKRRALTGLWPPGALVSEGVPVCGLLVLPTGGSASAAGLAGLRKAAQQNPHAYSNKTIVCVLTGHGLKDPTTVTERAQKPQEIPAELDALAKAIAG